MTYSDVIPYTCTEFSISGGMRPLSRSTFTFSTHQSFKEVGMRGSFHILANLFQYPYGLKLASVSPKEAYNTYLALVPHRTWGVYQPVSHPYIVPTSGIDNMLRGI